jgi:hypothetical protein
LRPYRQDLTGRLWEVLEDGAAGAGPRLRAACALAAYDPDSPRWAGVRGQVADRLIREDLLVIGKWARALQPVRRQLVQPLASGRLSDSERLLVTRLLVDYAEDQPDLLAQLALEADPRQYGVLLPVLAGKHRQHTLTLLGQELDRPLPAGAEQAKAALAQRQAQAAVTLLRLGQPERVWPLLRHSPDPSLRSWLIHRLAPLGADPEVLVRRLGEETDLSVQRALLRRDEG